MRRAGLFLLLLLVLSALAAACSGSGGGAAPPSPRPSIRALSPGHGMLGAPVTILGSAFGATQGTSTVTMGGTQAAVSSWSPSAVQVTVPAPLEVGSAAVVVTVGGIASAPAPFQVDLPVAVYVEAAGALSAFSLSSTGGLVALPGSPFTITGASFGGDSQGVQIDRRHRRLFVANNNSMAVFDVDKATGGLTPVTGSPFASGGSLMFGVAVSPDGSRVYGGNCSGPSVSAFSVSAGSLSLLSGAPFPASSCLDLPFLMQGGRFLYFNVDNSHSLFGWSVSSSGALVPMAGSPFATPASTVFGGVPNPARTRIYHPDFSGNRIFAFDVDPLNGALSQNPGSPYPVSYGPEGMAFNGAGSLLYTCPFGGHTVYAYSVGAGGGLALLGTSTSATFTGMAALGIDTYGQYLAVVDGTQNTVGLMVLGSGGKPTTFGGSFPVGGSRPNAVVVTP